MLTRNVTRNCKLGGCTVMESSVSLHRNRQSTVLKLIYIQKRNVRTQYHTKTNANWINPTGLYNILQAN